MTTPPYRLATDIPLNLNTAIAHGRADGIPDDELDFLIVDLADCGLAD